MSIQRFPGDFRLGVLNEPRDGVLDPRPGRVEPKLMVFLLLSGRQRFVLGGRRIEMDADPLPDGALFRIGTPTEVTFEVNEGRPLTKLSLAMPPDWLDTVAGAGALSALPGTFSVLRFVPGPAVLSTARHILREDTPLRRMALGMSLLDQVIADLGGDEPGGTGPGALILNPESPALLTRLRREIAATAKDKLTTAQLARRMGVGLRSLERQVQAQEGKSLGAFLRAERFDLALRALRAGAPVFAAASLAGFSSAENFATAFRRRYGLTPSQARRDSPRG